MAEIENAKIEKVSITMEDHGCLTFYVNLKGNAWCTAFGGYCIGKGYLGAEEFTSENGGGLVAMMRIMDTVGVHRWEDLAGKYIRVETRGWDSIKKIGNIIEDKWFDIEEFFKSYKR